MHCPAMYERAELTGTSPTTTNAIVTAGLRCAPLTHPVTNIPTVTANAHPAVTTIHPEFCPLLLLKSTFATTPSPNKIKIIVPMSSAEKFVVIQCIKHHLKPLLKFRDF